MKATIKAMTQRSVTVELEDGSTVKVPGDKVLMMWCNKEHLRRTMEGREFDVEVTLTWDGQYLTATGMALWI